LFFVNNIFGLSDVYYPGWQASIDGKITHIFQTDYVLRGVAVRAGTHVVKFDFRPLPFFAGALLSGLSLLVIVVLLISRTPKDPKRNT
jgi:uncharacterized membrane protein YfhO